jgi:protein-S-isoprenylcysteine O-methyltransferase Ste14
LWLLFAVYWAVVALLQSRSLRQFLAQIPRSASHSAILGWTGVALCLLGFGLAINARRHLGRNWGLPMSRKEQPELVTTGPYAIIRHPIYTGLIVAMLGSAIGVNVLWALPLVLAGAYFVYSARREETVMLQLFPEQYAAYMARTGMLAPCPLRRR